MKSGSGCLPDCVCVESSGSVSVVGTINCWACDVIENRRRARKRNGARKSSLLRFPAFASINFYSCIGTLQAFLLRRCVSVAREHGRADSDGVCAERRSDNLRRFKAGLKGAASGLAYDGLKNKLARFHHFAAKDDALDV